MAAYTAEQLATIIKMACKMDMPDLGEEDEQNFYIFEWINMFLQQNARKAYIVRFSDEINITATGYVSFLLNGQPIKDILEPLMLYDSTDKQLAKRTSFDGGNGWWREDAYSQLHVRGASAGLYRLKYLKYPDKITLGSQTPEYPPAGYHELITWVVSRIKLTKNYYQESDAVKAQADAVNLAAVRASTYARGTNSGPPSEQDAKLGG